MRIVNGKKFMEEGDNCPICLWLFNKEVKVVANNRAHYFRFECPEALKHVMEHRFTIHGELYVKNKTLRNQGMCPRCGHITGLVGDRKTNFHCHTCGTKFRPDGTVFQ